VTKKTKETNMLRWNVWRKWRAALAVLALTGVVATPVLPVAQSSTPAPVTTEVQQAQAPTPAQKPEPAPSPAEPPQVQTEGPAAPAAPAPEAAANTGRVSLSLGADWASAYYFRGIATTQNGGNNVQPYGEIGFRLLENMGPLTSLHVSPGIWNNWHWGGGLLVEPSDPTFWTEADLYFKMNAVWWEVFSTSVTFTYYTSPNNTFSSYSDVGLGFALSDAKWLGRFALNPSILFAFETTGEALVADGKKGIYMGIGLAPGYTFFADSSFPVNISTPMTFGFSLKDYYTVNGQNQTFGFFSGGPLLTLPLKFIPNTLGNWSLKAGVQFLVLNSNLKAVNTNDGFVPIGSVGLSLTY
jgi:hypothetical protein